MAAVLSTILGVLAGLLLAVFALRAAERRRARRLLDEWREVEGDRIAVDAKRQSRAVLRGQIAEQVAPLDAAFPWDPADARYLGRPIDYIVFSGLADVRSGRRDRLDEIVLVDVKTGAARLSTVERRIRDAVTAGRVLTRTVGRSAGAEAEVRR